ncbi:Potassium channel domain-containing protein [Caenorhabditis elegans]|uniref:Potassium channel domain-containing protein n=2 Tax=Caenorhabditis elegans TaxID=6239 RepID=G5EG92_CAEEL|nr:Potassium channel domain-containing protein [Caenorhabditis elegans]CAB01238.5 Potassium channel domain-containing protein [Caenorhabditis elegans]|eukprot:NP_502170.4 TWiK family of potassium channels [Caenorhabditis elegans]
MQAMEAFPSHFEQNLLKESSHLYSEPSTSKHLTPIPMPRSPTQPLRATSLFSNEIRRLKLQSEDINEESESCSSTSPKSSVGGNSDSSNPQVASHSGEYKNSDVKQPTTLRRKSAEAEDARSTSLTESENIGRTRTGSMSEDHKKPFKSILRNSPYLSKEDISQSNESTANRQFLKNRASSLTRKEKDIYNDRTEPGNNDVIDNYYAKNYYTVTGIYQKNTNFPRYAGYGGDNDDDDEAVRRNYNTTNSKKTMSMAQSTRSVPIVPVNNRFHKSFYWFAHNHKKIGFRHVCMLLLVLLYTLLGAALFFSIESRHEHETMHFHKRKLDRIIYEIAQTLELEVLDPMKLTNITQMEYFITRAYVKLLNAEDLYSGSTFYKHEDPKNLKWTYGSAFFFSMNVYTTTGYGSIAPSSSLGKALVIVYGLIFVPLTAVVIRDLGQWALLYLTKMYTILIDSFRRVRGFVDKLDEDEIITLPIKFSVSVMILYLLSATMFIFEYDELSGPPDSGISFFHAFYFSFISMSTIGLGDVMPNNVTFSPLITIMFFFGMPILKVVNRVTYICLENGVFGSMTVLENRLDTIWSKATVLPTGQVISEPPTIDVASRKTSMLSEGMIPDENDGSVPNEYLNNFTIRSIATFMKANGDVYGGAFGRVNIRRGDIRNPGSAADNQATVRSTSQRENNV